MLFAQDIGFFENRHGIVSLFDILYDFISNLELADIGTLKDILLHDWALMEKPRRYPKSIEPSRTQEQKDFIRGFYNETTNVQKYLPDYTKYSPSALARMCNIEFFDDDKTARLYDYARPKRTRACEIPLKQS
jgi:hypothetical protein